MIKSKMSVASGVLFASLMLVVGLLGWLQAANPIQAQTAGDLIDNSLEDFAGGSGCFVAQSPAAAPDSYGVILSPTVGTNFTGTVLPSGWFSTTAAYSPSIQQYVTVTDGLLTVDHATAYAGPGATTMIYTPTRTLEFSATFVTGTNSQFAGFGTDRFTGAPWAIFSNVSPSLTVRTNNGTDVEVSTVVTGSSPLSPHRYRIEWGTSNTIYFIDGAAVVTHDVAFSDAAYMRPEFQDNDIGGGSITVDWARMSDYAPITCTFESRVIDSGVNSTFKGLTTTVVTPAGTSMAFDVLTSTNGTDWIPSTWTAVNSDGTFTVGPSRYIKYRAFLTTTQPALTPEMLSVRVWGVGPNAVRLTSFAAAGSDFVARGLLIGLSAAVLAVGGVSVIFRRRRIAG